MERDGKKVIKVYFGTDIALLIKQKLKEWGEKNNFFMCVWVDILNKRRPRLSAAPKTFQNFISVAALNWSTLNEEKFVRRKSRA